MLLYKKFHIDNYEEIRQQLYNFFINRFELVETLSGIPTDELLAAVPRLQDIFDEHNLTVSFCAGFIRSPRLAAPIHIDDGHEGSTTLLALNLPILNCKDTYHYWFDIPASDLGTIHDRGNTYRSMPVDFDWTTLPQLDRLELTEPHLVRIDLPHNVVNDTDNYRMILSIRFHPQPFHLWPDVTAV